MERLRDLKNVPIFWSNYNLDLRSYGQLLSLFILVILISISMGSLGIAPTRNCTHFLKIWFVVAGGGFYSYYYIHKGNKQDNERFFFKKLSFMQTKRFNTFFKRWVQFRVGAISRVYHIYCLVTKFCSVIYRIYNEKYSLPCEENSSMKKRALKEITLMLLYSGRLWGYLHNHKYSDFFFFLLQTAKILLVSPKCEKSFGTLSHS